MSYVVCTGMKHGIVCLKEITGPSFSCSQVFVAFFRCNSNFGILFIVDRNLKELQHRTHINKTKLFTNFLCLLDRASL